MNNNQDNFNINPQIENMNNDNQSNNTFFNNQPGFIQNQNAQETFNVIPQNETSNFQNNLNQVFEPTQNNNNVYNPIQNKNNFNNNISNIQNNNVFNNNINTNTNIDNSVNNNQDFDNITKESILNNDGITAFQEHNRFINNNQQNPNAALNDLNIEGEYNGMPKVDYNQDPKVLENLQQQKKKNTITITGEAKVFLIIIVVLLLFTFIMPIIFDTIRDIQY